MADDLAKALVVGYVVEGLGGLVKLVRRIQGRVGGAVGGDLQLGHLAVE